MTRAIRVLIVDDHAILRSGLRMMLGSQRDIEVVGETGDLGEMLRLAQALAPDVITLDLSMPGARASAGSRSCARPRRRRASWC